MDAATAQWLATASGVLGARVATATVTALGRRVPRMFMLLVLVGMLLAVGGGAGIMIVDGFVGIGVGWQWYHGDPWHPRDRAVPGDHPVLMWR